jgi:uncharacterized protein YdeI (YjbR/CyaY-like superfamily)
MIKTENFEQVAISSPAELRMWLRTHYAQAESVWVVTYKKHVADKYVSTSQVLDELLCFGWIDGMRRKLDADRTMQLISPRQAQHWAKSYKDRAARLEREGRMEASGRAAIAASKRSGLWNFMDDVDALIQPDDLVAALKKYPPAEQNFNAFSPAVQRFALRWIKLAKQPATRARRIEQTARLAAKNERVPGS